MDTPILIPLRLVGASSTDTLTGFDKYCRAKGISREDALRGYMERIAKRYIKDTAKRSGTGTSGRKGK